MDELGFVSNSLNPSIRQFVNSSIPLRSLQELGHLLALAQRHVRLLPIRSASREASLPLHLAVPERRADALDLRPEQLLDGAPDIDLVGVSRDLEHQRASSLAHAGGLLGDQRAPQNVGCLHPSASCSFSSAARVTTT